MLKNILFDLDGTLTDSQEGVINCFRYATQELTQNQPTEAQIKPLIGIPIRSIFRQLLDSEDGDLINEAVNIYRRKFSESGVFQNTVYAGIPELLAELRQDSYKICIVTLKNQTDAEIIAKHFSFDTLVDGIYGPDLDFYPENKAELIKSALEQGAFVPGETVMIGDRKEDIISGKANGVLTIGVTYGYGSNAELADSAPDRICNDPSEIKQAIKAL